MDMSIQTSVEYHSCYISASSHDRAFAEQLYHDLQARGVRSWLWQEDLMPGEDILSRSSEAIRLYDKLLVIFSQHSIASKQVEWEVALALNREIRENKNIVVPICLDNAVWNATNSWAELIRVTRMIGDFRGWENSSDYQTALDKLLKALQVDHDAISTISETIASTPTLSLRINEEPLTTGNLAVIFSALTQLHTKLWLIEQDRIDDLTEYSQTGDSRFIEESALIIIRLTYNSPVWITVVSTVLSASGVAAMSKLIDTVVQAPLRFKEKELEIDHKRTTYHIEDIRQILDVVGEHATDEQKAAALNNLMPTLEALGKGKGLEPPLLGERANTKETS